MKKSLAFLCCFFTGKQNCDCNSFHTQHTTTAGTGGPLNPLSLALVQDDLLPAASDTKEVVHFRIGQWLIILTHFPLLKKSMSSWSSIILDDQHFNISVARKAEPRSAFQHRVTTVSHGDGLILLVGSNHLLGRGHLSTKEFVCVGQISICLLLQWNGNIRH